MATFSSQCSIRTVVGEQMKEPSSQANWMKLGRFMVTLDVP